ncbi:MAG: hypothetical protein R3Y35_11490 [Clostridia bacterium]
MKFTDFYEAFKFLSKHPVFRGHFLEQLDIEVVKVNPETKSIDSPPSKNTATRVWLECGHLAESDMEPDVKYHDYELDCGGDTFEEALIELAGYVYGKFGGYEIGVDMLKSSCIIFDFDENFDEGDY